MRPPATGAVGGQRFASRLRLTAGARLATSVANAEGHRERERSAPAVKQRSQSAGYDGKDASPHRRRPLPQGRMDGFVRFPVRRSQR